MVDRRDLLRGTALLTAAQWSELAQGNPQSTVATVTVALTRAELARSGLRPDSIVYLAEPGREGLFRCVTGRAIVTDPLQGLFVPGEPNDHHFARVWDARTGRPEWFGAKTNDGRADCAPAIEACVALCPVTQLAQVDYFIRRTLVLDHSCRTMHGSGSYAADQDQGTRIILQGSAPGIQSDDVLLVGARRQPGPTNDRFPMEIHLSDFTLIRDGAAAPHASGDLRRFPAGLRASFLTRCSFSRIASLESSVGFHFGGTVYCKVNDCLAQRLAAGNGSAPDFAAGFFLDGSPDVGLAGGNASLYLNRCLTVGQHAHHVRPTGLVAEGAFVDSFIDAFESARVDNGMRFSVAGAGGPAQTVDLHIRNCVLDALGGTGLEIDLTGTQSASVEVIDPYLYAAAAGGAVGIAVRDGGGLVTLTGGQVHGDFRDGSLLLRNTRGVRVQGVKLHEGSRPLVAQASGALQLAPQIMNLVRRTTAFAVTCTRVYRADVRPMVIGAPGMLGGGVSFDAGCNYSNIDTSAVDPGCFVTVDATRKAWFDGRDVNRGSGSVAFRQSGNVISGVPG